MLTKNAKTVYKITKKSKGCRSTYEDLEAKLNWDNDTLQSACNLLIDMGIAKTDYKAYVTSSGSQSVPCGIVLTEKGRNLRKYNQKSALEFVIGSILVPMLVAIATTIALRYI